MIKSKTWLLIEKFKKEREQYETYTSRITHEKVAFAQSRTGDKDIKILKLVNMLKICTSSQIAKVTFRNQTHQQRYCNTHLKKLFNLGCIDRFFPFVEHGSPQAHIVLAPIGARLIQEENFRKITTLNQNWKHLVASNEVFCHISSQYKVTNCSFEISLEWENKSITKKLRSDLFCGFIKNDCPIFIMVEIDLGTEPISELYKKVNQYNCYFQNNQFKSDYWQPMKEKSVAVIPSIVFILNDEKRKENLSKFINKQENVAKFHVQTFDNLSF